MMLKYLSFTIVVFTLGLTGCAFSTHMYHVSDNDPVNVGKPATDVVVDAERFVVLGFNFDVDYTDRAYEKLLAACPEGAIDHVHTRFSTALGFFSYTQKIHIMAKCYQ